MNLMNYQRRGEGTRGGETQKRKRRHKQKKTRKDELASKAASKILEQIRVLGYIPKQSGEHSGLARKYQEAVKDGKISALDQNEAQKLTSAQYGR